MPTTQNFVAPFHGGRLLRIGITAALLATSALRADVTFTDRNAFAIAVGSLGPTFENWGELPNGTILTNYNGITYTPGSPLDLAITTASYTCNGCIEGLGGIDLGYFGLSESMTFTFSTPTDIFGIDINTNAIDPDYTLLTNTGSSAVSGYDPFPGYFTGQFVGLIASTPFTSVTIIPAGNFLDNYTLDNLTYNSVPEPNLLLMTALLLGGFAIVRELRRRQALRRTAAVLGGLAMLLVASPGLRAQAPPPPPAPHAPPPQNFCGDTVTVTGPVPVTVPLKQSAEEGEEVPSGSTVCGGTSDSSDRAGLRSKKTHDKPHTEAINPTLGIPNWSYTAQSSRDGNTYTGTIVGGSPAASLFGNGTTSVGVVFLPVIWRFHTLDGVYIFDPTQSNAACGQTVSPVIQALESPLYQPHNWTFGGTQVGENTTFPDAFQRAEFWDLGGFLSSYHLRLDVSFPYLLIIDAYGSGFEVGQSNTVAGPCGLGGIVDYASFDNFFQTVIYPLINGNGVSPSNFPFLMFSNVVLGSAPNLLKDCCVTGYHNVFQVGAYLQTYGVADFIYNGWFGDTTDVASMTHETMEWINDPLTNNPVPAWGHIGQQPGCQNNLEVGDPLSGTNMPTITSNGLTYHLQELAFFSWFYGAPSIGVNGWYSSNNTFTSSAGPVCTEILQQ